MDDRSWELRRNVGPHRLKGTTWCHDCARKITTLPEYVAEIGPGATLYYCPPCGRGQARIYDAKVERAAS
jgi:hypothetical protein